MGTNGRYLGDAVYGALDGVVTTFAVVAGVAGAGLAGGIILILGFANLFADGVSMAAGNYLGKRSEAAYRRQERVTERAALDRDPATRRENVREIYRAKGFSGPQLTGIVAMITRDKERWTDELMVGKLGIFQEEINPLKSAFATFGAFVVAGLVPLLSYIGALHFPVLAASSAMLAFVLTGIALFVIGSLRSLLTSLSWWRAGTEMLIVGGLAAAVAYAIGWGLSGLA